GWRPVPGFEASELRVARCAKKLPKTQSWCFVPLIFSALGKVPEHLQREDTSTEQQIADAQQVWENLFSHWSSWRASLKQVIASRGEASFVAEFLPRGATQKSWATSL
ncbi:unnamed protein product, partial [Polarella glacialis]